MNNSSNGNNENDGVNANTINNHESAETPLEID